MNVWLVVTVWLSMTGFVSVLIAAMFSHDLSDERDRGPSRDLAPH
jgi:hypothetical protein